MSVELSSLKQGKYIGKRLAIMQAAYDIVSRNGIHGAKISEIAQEAQVADSIIYRYFENKEDLFLRIVDLLMKNALEELKFHFQGIIGPVSKLGKMIWYHLYMNDIDPYTRENTEKMLVEKRNTKIRLKLLMEARGNHNFLKHEAFGTLREYTGILDGILKDGVMEGCFREDLNIALTRSVIFGLLDEEALRGTGSKERTKTVMDFDEILRLVLSMVKKSSFNNRSDRSSDKFFSILQAAKHLFAEKGFHSTTMRQISLAADVSEGSIYQYFKGKSDLLLSITKVYFNLQKASLDKALSYESAFDKLAQLFWQHFYFVSGDKDFSSVFLENTKLNEQFYKSDAYDVFMSYHDKFVEVLEEGKDSGQFRQSVNNRIFRNLVIGGLSNAYNRWYFREPMTAINSAAEMNEFIELLCRSVMPSESFQKE